MDSDSESSMSGDSESSVSCDTSNGDSESSSNQPVPNHRSLENVVDLQNQSEQELIAKAPKKRGRPPKPKLPEDLLPKIPKKRGPKPKIALEDGEMSPKVPKKQGSKPKINTESGEQIFSQRSSRGRPRIKPIGPKGPPKKRGRKKKKVDTSEVEAKLQFKNEKKAARRRLRQQKFERMIQERENRRKLKEIKKVLKDGEVKKKRGRQPKEDFQFIESEETPPEQNTSINNAKALETLKHKMLLSHVPGYKCRRLLSCCYCQQWSWDLRQCANCMRSFSLKYRTLCIEDYELITQKLHNDRPFFHPPPIPYYRPGRAVFCKCCFYYSSNESQCDECNASIPANTQRVFIDFENRLDNKQNTKSWVDRFKPRKVNRNMIECPYCRLTLLHSSRHCPHCKNWLPRNVTVVPEGGTPPDWPTASMIEQGVINELPLDYVPFYRENTVSMCRWCSTTVWDLNRCYNCLRKLPDTSDLLTDGPCFDFVDGKNVIRPVFSPKPFPYLRPGLSVICPDCNEYSKDSKHCDNCGKYLTNRSYVNVCFKRVKGPLTNVTTLPLLSRKVNDTYFVCPYCEFSIPNWTQCIHCLKHIPKFVTILPATTRETNESKHTNKLDSVFHTITLAILGLQNLGEQNRKQRKPNRPINYVPRYRERGIGQCPNCLSWTWDMDRCMLCFLPVHSTGNKPLVIYPKPGVIKDITIEKFRPEFAKPPLPYLRPGRWTFCSYCYCYIIGPPFCTECGKLLEDNPQYVNIDFTWTHSIGQKLSPYSKQVPYKLRLTIDGKLALCPHCGYTTENFQNCSFCKLDIPSTVLITPENPELHSFKSLEKAIEPEISLPALKEIPTPTDVHKIVIKHRPSVLVRQVGPILYLPSTDNIKMSNISQNTNFLESFQITYEIDSRYIQFHQALANANVLNPHNFSDSSTINKEEKFKICKKMKEFHEVLPRCNRSYFNSTPKTITNHSFANSEDIACTEKDATMNVLQLTERKVQESLNDVILNYTQQNVLMDLEKVTKRKGSFISSFKPIDNIN